MTGPHRIAGPLRWIAPRTLGPAALSRADYAKLPRAELERRLEAARDRIGRADTESAYMADAYAIQELEAALGEESK